MRALVIGTGSIGLRHMTNLSEAAPGIEFILVRRSESKPLLDWEHASSVLSIEAGLALSPDMAVLANPTAFHFDSLMTLVRAGIPTYVEKPVVTRRQEVEAIRTELRRGKPVPHVTGYNLRLLPSLAAAKRLVVSGALGSIVRATFEAGQWLPDWRRGRDHRTSYSAHTAEGGGVIFDLSHELDAARFLLGEINLTAAATAQLPSLEIDSESVATMVGRSITGTLLSVSVDYVARAPIRRYVLVGDKATLVWDLPTRSLTMTSAAGASVITSNEKDFDVVETYRTAMASFSAAVAGQESQHLQDLEDGLRSAELSISAHELDGPQ